MNRKGSMELGVNSIVILIIAIVMLGLILGIIVPKIKEAGLGLGSQEPDPTPASVSMPISLSRDQVSVYAGEDAILKVSIYNPGIFTGTGTAPTSYWVSPQVAFIAKVGTNPGVCAALTAEVRGAMRSITFGEQGQFTLILKTSKSAAPGTYLCTINPVFANAVTAPTVYPTVTLPGVQVKDFTIKIMK